MSDKNTEKSNAAALPPLTQRQIAGALVALGATIGVCIGSAPLVLPTRLDRLTPDDLGSSNRDIEGAVSRPLTHCQSDDPFDCGRTGAFAASYAPSLEGQYCKTRDGAEENNALAAASADAGPNTARVSSLRDGWRIASQIKEPL